MPQKRAAYKAIRKSGKKRRRNEIIISEIKTLTKKFNALLSEKKFDQAGELLKAVSSRLNKAAQKNVIRKNAASRKISRLSKTLYQATAKK